MNEFIIPFLLTLSAGLSTIIGTFFIFTKININKLTQYSLAFASGVMICVSLFDLIPESLRLLLNNNVKIIGFSYTIIFIVLGLFIGFILDKKVPENNKVKNKEIYRVGIISMIAIIIHNLFEGMITFITSTTSLGLIIWVAILLHNITEGITISIPVYNATNSRKKAFKYTFISALAEPIGGIVVFFLLKPYITDNILGFLLAITAGIMCYISFFELLNTSLKYKKRKFSLLYFILGIIFIILTHYILS